MSQGDAGSLKTYWGVWGVLLSLTLVMVVVDRVALPPLLFALVMVAAMLTKAGLIAAYFMHLRWERVVLAWMVLIGLLLNGTILYALMVPDAFRILAMQGGS